MSHNDKNRYICMSDIDDFDLCFELVMDHPITSKPFNDYLILTKNRESSEFLSRVTYFRQSQDADRTAIAKTIIYWHIYPGSELEINIDSITRHNIITTMDHPITLFDHAVHQVVLDLKNGAYAQFINSDGFRHLLVQQRLSLLYDIGTPKHGSILQYIESLGGIHHTVEEVKTLRYQVLTHRNDEWDIIGCDNEHKTACYFSKKSYNVGTGTGLNFFKIEIYLPYNVMDCMTTIMDNKHRIMIDQNLTSIEHIAYLHPTLPGQLHSSISRDVYSMTWPFTDREFIVSSSGIHDETSEHNLYMICMKTIVYNIPERKNLIRCSSVGCYAFQHLSSECTKFTQFFCIDFKAPIPKTIIKRSLNLRAKNFRKLTTKHILMRNSSDKNENNYICQSIHDNHGII